MIDTHCHIFDEVFDNDRQEVISRAKEVGVAYMLMPNVDKSTYGPMMNVARLFPEYCIPMIGIHPTSIEDNLDEELSFLEQAIAEQPPNTFCAIGEVGIDCYWSKEYIENQKIAFREQIGIAERMNLPIVIHARNSFNEIFDVLRDLKPNVRGVFHAYSGSMETYHEIKRLGNYKLGIGGVVTFKNAKLPEVIAQVPIEDIILETDAPYLTPAPYRGKRNESAYLELIVQKIAEAKNMPMETIKEVTTANAKSLFTTLA
ncbi:MAG: TatD family hydrolase [Prevotellaceae bacterium]|jgi:TatD DNase family protein|nr:TatD family hydrolase [Prevotellaceae bacterium]